MSLRGLPGAVHASSQWRVQVTVDPWGFQVLWQMDPSYGTRGLESKGVVGEGSSDPPGPQNGPRWLPSRCRATLLRRIRLTRRVPGNPPVEPTLAGEPAGITCVGRSRKGPADGGATPEESGGSGAGWPLGARQNKPCVCVCVRVYISRLVSGRNSVLSLLLLPHNHRRVAAATRLS